MDSLASLLKVKGFEDISVQEIAEQATLNRNTFYLHYSDKNALLQAMTEARFRDLLERRGISFTNCKGALRATALGVCDYLTELTNCAVKGPLIPLEGSIIPVIASKFMEAAGNHILAPGINAQLLATTGAWAVFGAARNWYQSLDRVPAEEMADRIEALVLPMFLNSFK